MQNQTQNLARAALIWGAVFGGTGVALGALGAHALKNVLPPDLLESYLTGVKFQMYHALALVAIGAAAKFLQFKTGRVALGLFVAGTFCFSGSIYLLTLARLKEVALVTPLGGLLLIAGWAALALAAYKRG